MDFAREHISEESVACKSKIRYIPKNSVSNTKEQNRSLDEKLIEAANRAAKDLLVGPVENPDPRRIDASLFPDRYTPLSDKIKPNDLVVIFESFDNLNFLYAKPGDIYSNRHGVFHHEDFIGKPFGCKIRSRNNRGYGFVFLLKPTPELWARSLNHRTQIVHELDASMVVFYLNLRPNMVVCESGTGSGSMSHAILRTIAPRGKLHTFEFNKMRAETARKEFETHGLSHLVEVHHKDVCGKQPVTTEDETIRGTANRVPGGFDLPGRSVNAIFLDLPEPWLAVPHAAYTLKPDGRLASYSPCIEQTQRTVAAMTASGFHTIKTMEFRIRENYVDEVEYELPPKEKRPRIEPNPYLVGNNNKQGHHSAAENDSGGEDTGAEADNEKSEISETEADQLSLATAGTTEETAIMDAAIINAADAAAAETKQKAAIKNGNAPKGTGGAPSEASNKAGTSAAKTDGSNGGKRKKMLIARPFPTMRGHTAFLTFATAGNAPQPDPNKATSSFIS